MTTTWMCICMYVLNLDRTHLRSPESNIREWEPGILLFSYTIALIFLLLYSSTNLNTCRDWCDHKYNQDTEQFQNTTPPQMTLMLSLCGHISTPNGWQSVWSIFHYYSCVFVRTINNCKHTVYYIWDCFLYLPIMPLKFILSLSSSLLFYC